VNGDHQWVNCRNHTREEIQKWINLLRTQNGNSSALRYRKMWHTDVPSIQGAWTPFTPKNPLHNLVVYPSNELSQPQAEEKSATERLIEMFEQQKLGQASLEKKRAE
jgi:large subunit ribosomal protein L43